MDLQEDVEAGDPPAGSWVALPSPAAVEVVAGEEPEFLVVDTEHTPAPVETVENCVRAVVAAGMGVEAFVRVAWNDPVRIKRLLDTGPDGLVVPQVDDGEAAAALVSAATYPPAGERGVAAARDNDYGRSFESSVVAGEDRPTLIAQIETERAVENAGEIAAVDGIDALFVGPADLSAALDAAGDYDCERFREAVDAVLSGATVPVGTLATTEAEIGRWLSAGFDFLVVGTDVGYLRSGVGDALSAYADQTT